MKQKGYEWWRNSKTTKQRGISLANFSIFLSTSFAGQAQVFIDTLISAVFVMVFVEALVLALVVSTVFVEALVLATVLAAFFFPARGFLFVRVLLSGWEQHALFLFCARVTCASPMASLIRNCLVWSDIDNIHSKILPMSFAVVSPSKLTHRTC